MTRKIDAPALKRRLDEGSAIVIDIRTQDEFVREHIPGARLVPVAAWHAHDLDRDAGKAVVFTCRSGLRSEASAASLFARELPEAYILDGGIEGWKRAGLPVHRNAAAPLDLQRQVQIGVGAMILLGLALAVLVSPVFLMIPAVVGVGLLVAGLTGFCGLARLLALMPWNRPRLPAAA